MSTQAAIAPSDTANGFAWYVVQSKPRQEFRALENLRNQGYQCVMPLYQRERMNKGVRALREEPLFPRYLFIQLDTSTSNWAPIRSTFGVAGIVRFGGIPAAMPDGMVELLMQRGGARQNLFAPGDKVKVVSGLFTGLEGVFAQDDGLTRVVVLLEFMQTQQKLSVPVRDVRLLV